VFVNVEGSSQVSLIKQQMMGRTQFRYQT